MPLFVNLSRHHRDLASLYQIVQSCHQALRGRRRALRFRTPLNTRERRCILVAGHLDDEIWNTELDITGTTTFLVAKGEQAVSDEAFEPHTRGAHAAEPNERFQKLS